MKVGLCAILSTNRNRCQNYISYITTIWSCTNAQPGYRYNLMRLYMEVSPLCNDCQLYSWPTSENTQKLIFKYHTGNTASIYKPCTSTCHICTANLNHFQQIHVLSLQGSKLNVAVKSILPDQNTLQITNILGILLQFNCDCFTQRYDGASGYFRRFNWWLCLHIVKTSMPTENADSNIRIYQRV